MLSDEAVEGGRIYVVAGLHPGNPGAHRVYVPTEALDDRARVYGVATSEDALDLILWEHYLRLDPSRDPAAAPAAVRAVWGEGCKAVRGLPTTDAEREAVRRRLDTHADPVAVDPRAERHAGP